MLLEVEKVHKTYVSAAGPVTILDGVSFSMQPGETLALTGESGSGKSTLLHIAAGLEEFDQGHIRVDGTDLAGMKEPARAALRRDVLSVVFQQFNLIPSLNVADNIAFQARLSGAVDKDWITEITTRLGLEALTKQFPEQLSGGQQQRVAIGRALAARPKLVLADEPTGNLDEATGDAVMGLLLDLVATSNAALLMVTHSDRLAGQLDRRLHLRRGALER